MVKVKIVEGFEIIANFSINFVLERFLDLHGIKDVYVANCIKARKRECHGSILEIREYEGGFIFAFYNEVDWHSLWKEWDKFKNNY